ncbi:MAG: aggregation factor core [Pseudomonadota bacterium]
MKTPALTLSLALFATAAAADIQVRFKDGAPKDRFTVTNTGACDLGPAQVKIDLSGSPFGLIFDVTSQGAGVQVFQPFEIATGGRYLAATPDIADGDNAVTLDFTSLPAGDTFAFTIDIDDTVKSREIIVSGEEIVGAMATVSLGAAGASAVFDADGLAEIGFAACTS